MKRLLLLALFIAPAGRVLAQNCQTPNGANGTCTLNVASSLTIPTVIRLTIDDTTTALTTPTEVIFNTGTASSAGPSITVQSNSPWTLYVRAGAATWTGVGAVARVNKPAGDLGWNITGGASYATMTTVDATVKSGTRTASDVTQIYYQVNWSWPLDTPGTYSLVVQYTVTSP